MKKIILISVLTAMLLSLFLVIHASNTQNDYNLDVFPNPMESYGTVSAFFTEKIHISVVLVDADELYVKTIYEGISTKGQMLIPFDRMNEKDEYIPKGKYWVVLTTDAKYTSTKKLLILK